MPSDTCLSDFDPATCALLLDVDGTLIDLAQHPDDVVVPPDLVKDLAFLHERMDGALALVSGRTIGVMDRLFRPLRLPASGAHGAEFRFTPAAPVIRAVRGDLPATLLERLTALSRRTDGLLLEDKKICIAVHYRDNAAAGPWLRAEIDEIIEDMRDLALSVIAGHFVFEIKRQGHDKGTAVSHFMQRAPFKGRRPYMIGDDVTDEAGFAVAPSFGGYGISVGREVPGVPTLFSTASDVRAWVAATASRHRVAA